MPSGPSLNTLYKLGNGAADDLPWANSPGWAIEELGKTERLVIAPPRETIHLLKALLNLLPEPLWLLYVLVVPRGEGAPGRYQSPHPLSREDMRNFLATFEAFLERDGRHNLWILPNASQAMLVYDRHNLIYAYGPLPDFTRLLEEHGLAEVPSNTIAIPNPHSHHYHAALDTEAQRLLASFAWKQTPLKKQDTE